jgi:L-threonylcarbamoyladenylate synthase
VTAPAAGPRVVEVDPQAPGAEDLSPAVHAILRGRLVAFPTETFYGLGANALDPEAVLRVFRAKGRPPAKPLLVLVDDVAAAEAIASPIPARARILMDRYWPGPLTLILPARPHLPAALTAGTGTVGVRVSSHPVARGLARAAGVPITAPSANRHGAPGPRTPADVLAGLGAVVDLVVDGGPAPGGPPSTLLDATVTPFRVVRAGVLTLEPTDLGAD